MTCALTMHGTHVASVIASSVLFVACGDAEDARTREVASLLTRADEAQLQTRPLLVASKYQLMARTPYAYFRGSLPVYAQDVERGRFRGTKFSLGLPLVRGLGDPHVENFGTLRAADGSLGLEPNDFDAADRVPFLWDVRRLATSMALATSIVNLELDERVAIVTALTQSYVDALAEPIGRVTRGAGGPIVDDLFRRAERDAQSREELDELTLLEEGTRYLKRGSYDPDDPAQTLLDTPKWFIDALPDYFERARPTLGLAAEPGFFRVLDVARLHGSGVASLPRARFLVLVEGPTEERSDDVIVELKEVFESGTGSSLSPGARFRTVGERISDATRFAWAGLYADPLWTTGEAFGMTLQMRTESAAHKTIRVARMTGALGSREALVALARTLGPLLARVHATPTEDTADPASAILDFIGDDVDAFVGEQADFAIAYASQTLDDRGRLERALAARGPWLGADAALPPASTPSGLASLIDDRRLP